MDSSAANESTPALPEEASKPPEGVVVPPKDIRVILEKTAGYVVRNGERFEERIREKEQNNPKFSFLNINDPYAAFYRWRLNEIKEGRGTAVSMGRPGEAVAAPEVEKPKGPAEPPAFHFSARMPIINAQDLEVVKLTALFVAQRGKSFMTALSQREARNYQFDFLRPQHSLYQFFTRLVDQYTILLRSEGLDADTSEQKRLAELEHNIKDKYHILERAKQRAEWVKYQEQQKQKKEIEEERERLEYAQIDWHDFVVVETVVFTEADDQTELPPPTSLMDLQSASLEQKAMMSLKPLRIEEAMPTDEDAPTYYNAFPPQAEPLPAAAPAAVPAHQPAAAAAYPVGMQAPQVPQGPAAQQPGLPASPMPVAAAAEEEDLIRERMAAREQAAATQAAAKATPGVQPMRIRSDYVPRAQARRPNAASQTALCPNCHQQIPVNELDQHMRIELLDPRWKEQRAKAESRSATTNLSTADVVNNLKRLASQRSDVFDSSLLPAGAPGQTDQDEEARRKRLATGYSGVAAPVLAMGEPPGLATAAAPLPPGAPGTVPAPATTTSIVPPPPPPNPQPVNIEEQIRQIHERYKQ